jgi:uncharacterized membrane protein (DUF485 family)
MPNVLIASSKCAAKQMIQKRFSESFSFSISKTVKQRKRIIYSEAFKDYITYILLANFIFNFFSVPLFKVNIALIIQIAMP